MCPLKRKTISSRIGVSDLTAYVFNFLIWSETTEFEMGDSLGLFRAGIESIRREGVGPTFRKISQIPSLIRARARLRGNALNGGKTLEERFSWIYEENYWGNQDSKSGNGSSLEYTEKIRGSLPVIFDKYAIKSVLDAPCGYFHWMRHVVVGKTVRYIGADIVPQLISKLQAEYEEQNISFVTLDLTSEPMPPADLLFCRDLLFHLSFDDARKVLENYLEAGIPYILTTSHELRGIDRNLDIISGDFRMVDLTIHPFNFPAAALEIIPDFKPPDPERNMKLWTRRDVAIALGKQI